MSDATSSQNEAIESLYGKIAMPGVEWDEAELDSYLHDVGTEWERELDELNDDDNANVANL